MGILNIWLDLGTQKFPVKIPKGIPNPEDRLKNPQLKSQFPRMDILILEVGFPGD